MSKNPPKKSDSLLPIFGGAVPSVGASVKDVKTGTPEETDGMGSRQRKIELYGAAFNAMDALFRLGHAVGIPRDNLSTKLQAGDNYFSFSVAIVMDETLPEYFVTECANGFFKNIYDHVEFLELDKVDARQMILDDSNGQQILLTRVIFEDDGQLMEYLEAALQPYSMNMGMNFTESARPHPDAGSEPLRFSPLYSLEHIKALYKHAHGHDHNSSTGQGMHLSH